MADERFDIAERAEQEAVAQLTIIRTLKPLSADSRSRVMEAIALLLEADRRVPGILETIRTRTRRSETESEEATHAG